MNILNIKRLFWNIEKVLSLSHLFFSSSCNKFLGSIWNNLIFIYTYYWMFVLLWASQKILISKRRRRGRGINKLWKFTILSPRKILVSEILVVFSSRIHIIEWNLLSFLLLHFIFLRKFFFFFFINKKGEKIWDSLLIYHHHHSTLCIPFHSNNYI